MEVVWKNISGFQNYLVSSDGRILSKKRTESVLLKNRINKHKQTTSRHLPYHMVMLYGNGKQHGKFVHRLVAQAFIPNPDNKPQVNHKDNNVQNNRIENLEWCTASENRYHFVRTNPHIDYTKSIERLNKYRRVRPKKLTEASIGEIKEKYRPRIYSLNKLASEYDVSKKTILRIIQTKNHNNKPNQ